MTTTPVDLESLRGHTPGPWRVGSDLIRVHPSWRDERGNADRTAFHSNGFAKTIATVGKEEGDWRGIEQQVADARAVAAIPDMIAELTERRAEVDRLNKLAEAISRDCNECANARNSQQARADRAEEALAESRARDSKVAELVEAAHKAEAALADIGDADREPGDNLAWCEDRAAQALPSLRAALAALRGDTQ